MSPPNIEVPWLDPLGLFDSYLHLVSNRDHPWMGLWARVGEDTGLLPIPKGASRSEWIARLAAVEDSVNPIVSFVPHWDQEHGITKLTWRALRFFELPAWLKRFDAVEGYRPTATCNVTAFLKMARTMHYPVNYMQFSDAEKRFLDEEMENAVRHRTITTQDYYTYCLQQRQFTEMFKAHLHPTSNGLAWSAEDPTCDWGLAPTTLAQLFVVERADSSHRFQPMMEILSTGESGGSSAMRCKGHAGDEWDLLFRRSRTRQAWRRVQSHGFRPTPSFYGKTWLANRSSPEALYAGIELEMCLDNRGERNAISALFNMADEFGTTLPTRNNQGSTERLHIERDGSVVGLEVPLMPHEIGSYHAELFWRKAWNTVCAVGASNESGTAGMHIHVNANTALSPPDMLAAQINSLGVHPRPAFFRETTGFLIDLITNMLAGGPHLWGFKTHQETPANMRENVRITAERGQPYHSPVRTITTQNTVFQGNEVTGFQSERAITLAFGRPQAWSSNYARLAFSLCRKDVSLNIERYRAVNWCNEQTIEFRLFGPLNYNNADCDDWLNVTTQLTAAIIAYSRMHAMRMVLKGVEHRNEPFTTYWACIPKWLRPMLVVDDYIRGVNVDSFSAGTRQHRTSHTNTGVYRNAPEDPNGYGYAVLAPGVERTSPLWLLGVVKPMNSHGNDTEHAGRYTSGAILSLMGSAEVNRPFLSARRAQLHSCCMTLWRKFITFMRSESPHYELALAYIERVVEPLLPNDAVMEGLARWLPHITPAMEPLHRAREPDASPPSSVTFDGDGRVYNPAAYTGYFASTTATDSTGLGRHNVALGASAIHNMFPQ